MGVPGQDSTSPILSRGAAMLSVECFFVIFANINHFNMSKVAAYYHIVFCTRNREMTIPSAHKEDVYRYIWKVITNYNCKLIRIGGIQNHIHILLNLHPSVALADLVKAIKAQSSGWMSTDHRFNLFKGWAAGYYAGSISPNARRSVIEYIKAQETHHRSQALDNEFIDLYKIADIPYDNRDML